MNNLIYLLTSDSISFKAEFLKMRADCKKFVPLNEVNLFLLALATSVFILQMLNFIS